MAENSSHRPAEYSSPRNGCTCFCKAWSRHQLVPSSGQLEAVIVDVMLPLMIFDDGVCMGKVEERQCTVAVGQVPWWYQIMDNGSYSSRRKV